MKIQPGFTGGLLAACLLAACGGGGGDGGTGGSSGGASSGGGSSGDFSFSTQPRSAYDLNGGTDFLWRWLYRYGRWIPFVEAVYGNAAYTMAQPGAQWGIYVTLSGYLVKPLKNSVRPEQAGRSPSTGSGRTAGASKGLP